MELSSSSSTMGSSKRAKAPTATTTTTGNVNQVVVSCLVDGCNSDLSQCREYHRRHKVCEPHSKTPMVTIGGRQQRFCQQCSRFHSLEEFDEGKRSCRKRLDGHNRRRRKPQSDSLTRTTSGIFFSSPQGTRLLSFGSPQLVANPATSSAWLGSVKAENDSGIIFNNSPLNYVDKHNCFPINTGHSYKEMNQFQFIQGTDDRILPEASSVNNRMFCDGLNRAGNSDRALSLLSSAPASQTQDVGSSHVVHHEPVPQPHSMRVHSSLQFGGVGQLLFPYSQEMENKGVVSDGESSGSRSNNNNNNNNTTLHFQGMFQDGPDGSSASGGGGSHQTLSFGW